MTMFSLSTLLLGLVCLTLAAGENLSASQLRQLYNTKVRNAQRYKRPATFGSSLSAWFSHNGVVVDTVDGGRWLIHKGRGYGTVVTNASNMSSRWQPIGPKKTITKSTVRDYVVAGGAKFNQFLDNSWHATSRMMSLD